MAAAGAPSIQRYSIPVETERGISLPSPMVFCIRCWIEPVVYWYRQCLTSRRWWTNSCLVGVFCSIFYQSKGQIYFDFIWTALPSYLLAFSLDTHLMAFGIATACCHQFSGHIPHPVNFSATMQSQKICGLQLQSYPTRVCLSPTDSERKGRRKSSMPVIQWKVWGKRVFSFKGDLPLSPKVKMERVFAKNRGRSHVPS